MGCLAATATSACPESIKQPARSTRSRGKAASGSLVRTLSARLSTMYLSEAQGAGPST